MATLTTLAQYHIAYGGHMDNGWGWGMFVVMLLVVLGLVALVAWLVQSTTGNSSAGGRSAPAANDVLALRLAEGAITPDEYRERMATLGKK